MPLTIWRRHTPKCPHRKKGRFHVKCNCPIWTDGELHGKRYRRGLKTRDWGRAARKLGNLESPESLVLKPISEATAAWTAQLEIEPSTKRKYQNTLRQLEDFCKRNDLDTVSELTIETLDRFRAGRGLSRTTSARELQVLRQFFDFSVKRKWASENVAKEIERPPKPKSRPVEPYIPQEVADIIAAAGRFGRHGYERLRARAMVLLLRYTALRISDVAMLAKDRVRNGQVLLHTQKTGELVFLPVPPELQAALDSLPLPRDQQGRTRDSGYFFWNGVTSQRAAVGMAERTMAAVFKESGVPRAHAHRFRHTLATSILATGGTLSDVADVLGIGEHVARKHYKKWNQARQERISALMQAVHRGTFVAHTEKGAVIN